MGRFMQAIAEGDGISVVPLLEGDVAGLAGLAEEAGAEAVAVWSAEDVELARAQTDLPILVRAPRLDHAEEMDMLGADACALSLRALDDDGVLERVYTALSANGIDCLVEVREEEQLEEALDRVDPEMILISERERDDDSEELERTLDLLVDVPAGKLVVSEAHVAAREQVVALERAGVDAILVGSDFLREAPDFASALAELTGR
jgi:indole-3-glycerol phosphate synthase